MLDIHASDFMYLGDAPIYQWIEPLLSSHTCVIEGFYVNVTENFTVSIGNTLIHVGEMPIADTIESCEDLITDNYTNVS